MPYRCQKCLNTFKSLPLYNKHATGPGGACNVEKIEVAKPVGTPVALKREPVDDQRSRSERKKLKSYRETNSGFEDKADQVLADALGDDSDCDPDYNPKNDKEDDDDKDIVINKKKLKISTPTATSRTKSYTRITIPKTTFPCPKCNKIFETKTKLDEHVSDDHEERSCAECEDDFFWPDPSHECYFTKYKLRMLAGDIVPAF